uniref:Kelch-like family member 38a n=1 Tax=Lates calcarifer TaxID=8187 RepID=A0A4W6CM58_LATCA
MKLIHFYSELPSHLLAQLNILRQERILTDVLLCTEHQEIPCHRNVLVSSSPYFRAMFCSNFLESSQARVNLKGISSNVLAGIVDYVYTGCVTITMDIVLPLMQAASMLHYGGLFEACSLFLQDQLSPENCLSMIRLSEILHCESLRERAKEMAVRCFSDVAATEDFCELSLPELMCYLEDDRLCAEEEQVFETLLAWIHHDPFSRRGAIHDLFKKVRLRYIHPTYLFQFIANDPLVQSSTLCTEIIESVRRLMLTVSTKCSRELKPLWTTPRRYTCRETLVVVGGRKNNEQTSREALLYDERTHRWQWLAKLPLRLYKAAYVCIHSILYVLGGLSLCMTSGDSSVSATVYTLSLKTNQWRTAEPMLEPRYAHQSVSYLHFIFVLGGIGVDKRIAQSVERYNSMFNQWEAMAPMPTAVLHPGPSNELRGPNGAMQRVARTLLFSVCLLLLLLLLLGPEQRVAWAQRGHATSCKDPLVFVRFIIIRARATSCVGPTGPCNELQGPSCFRSVYYYYYYYYFFSSFSASLIAFLKALTCVKTPENLGLEHGCGKMASVAPPTFLTEQPLKPVAPKNLKICTHM